MEKEITFICVYNNRKQLDEMLLKSLDKINATNMILFDNTKKVFRSAAEAYNTIISSNLNILTSVLVFLHQDIAFDNDEFCKRLVCELHSNPEQLLGFAGMSQCGRTVSNLKYWRNKHFITKSQIKEKTEVYSLDECCFALTKELFLRLYFDQYVCNNWHLYAVDLCYEAKRKFGIKSYVLPEVIYHKQEEGSGGLYVDSFFLQTLWRMTRKYRRDFTVLHTPCIHIQTNLLLAALKILKSYLKVIYRK